MTTYHLDKASDASDFARRAAELMASYIDLALDQSDRAQVALSGGSTPQLAYSLLGEEHLPWDRVDLFLGDERWVDLKDSASNAGMLRKTLLAGPSGRKAAFHEIPTVQMSSPEESAKAFSSLLQKNCVGEPPVFDLIVLGLGDDGHTASLFPGTEAAGVTDRWVAVSKGKGIERVTLTAPVLSAARKVIFLVAGETKEVALNRLLDPAESPLRTPAKLVQPSSEILVVVDESLSR